MEVRIAEPRWHDKTDAYLMIICKLVPACVLESTRKPFVAYSTSIHAKSILIPTPHLYGRVVVPWGYTTLFLAICTSRVITALFTVRACKPMFVKRVQNLQTLNTLFAETAIVEYGGRFGEVRVGEEGLHKIVASDRYADAP